MDNALEFLQTINTSPMPPLMDEEVLFDFRCRRLLEDDRLRLADDVVNEATRRGATGRFRREILWLCEEPLLNVQRYQNVRIEMRDLKIHFRASFINGNQYYVTMSNYVYPEDAEVLASYLQVVSEYDGETARAKIRDVLPKAEVQTAQGSGIGLMLLRQMCDSFEYTLEPEGDFFNYTLRISLLPKTNTKVN